MRKALFSLLLLSLALGLVVFHSLPPKVEAQVSGVNYTSPPATGNTWPAGTTLQVYIDPATIPFNVSDTNSQYYQVAVAVQTWSNSLQGTGVSLMITTNQAQANVSISNNPQMVNGAVQPGLGYTSTQVFQVGQTSVGPLQPLSASI